MTGVAYPAIHFRLLLLRTGDIEPNPEPICSYVNMSIRCDVTHIVCSSGQWHNSRGAAALPSTTTVNSISALPRRCLLGHTKTLVDIRPIMRHQCPKLEHRKCSGISRYATNHSWLCTACPLLTTSISASAQPIIAMTDNVHSPTVLPRATSTNSPFLPPHPH